MVNTNSHLFKYKIETRKDIIYYCVVIKINKNSYHKNNNTTGEKIKHSAVQ